MGSAKQAPTLVLVQAPSAVLVQVESSKALPLVVATVSAEAALVEGAALAEEAQVVGEVCVAAVDMAADGID